MRLGLVIGTALALAACAAADGAGGDGDYMDDDLPMGNCSGGTSGGACPSDSGNVPAGFPCSGTQECTGDLSCVAPFMDDEVGEFTCSAQCIPNDDEAWWCIDAAACCDPAATCSPRGLCVLPVALDDTAADGATMGDATATVGSTGGDPTGTAGTGDAGSGTDAGSDSSAGSSGSSSGGG